MNIKICFQEEVDSTNLYAKRMAEEGRRKAPSLWLMHRQQAEGGAEEAGIRPKGNRSICHYCCGRRFYRNMPPN